VAQCVSTLRGLLSLLNRASHHEEGDATSQPKEGEAVRLIQEALESATAFVGELPWHLRVSFVYGGQPKVLSGEAWSHGSSIPRFLRAMQWAGQPESRQVLLWNKTRTNPIITDPVFIVRPHAT
jgi:hypothetical protein